MHRVALVLVVWLAALALPGVAFAHAGLRSAEPAPDAVLDRPPAGVRVALSGEVEDEFLDLDVTGPGGALASGPPAIDPLDGAAIVAPLDGSTRGEYAVLWRVLAKDGHPDSGSYVFRVGDGPLAAAPAPPGRGSGGPLPVLARLLVLVGPLALLGLAVLRFGVVAPAWKAGGVTPPGEPSADVRDAAAAPLAAAFRGWWWAWWAFAAVAALGLVLLPVATLATLEVGLDGLGDLLRDTRFGASWTVQCGALAVAVGAAAVWSRRASASDPSPRLAWAVPLLLGPLVGLGATSWLGHASQGADPELGIVIDAVHSWASAAWLGGLVGLAALLPAALGAITDTARVRLAAGVVVRFSALAVSAVAAVLLTGVYRSLVELSSLDDLLDTAYGRALLVKLGLVTILLGAGAYNRFVVHPRLERAALGLASSDRGACEALRVSVRAELALALGVMVAVAALVSLPPPA